MTEAEMIAFAQTVKDMRTAQNNFFATRKKEYLVEAKTLEKTVDRLLTGFNLK